METLIVEEAPAPTTTVVVTPISKEATELACRAKGVLEQYGWIQGKAGSPSMGFCLYGAFTMARLQSGNPAIAINEEPFLEIWHELTKRLGGSPAAWNDAPGRTKEEVIATLEEYCVPTD